MGVCRQNIGYHVAIFCDSIYFDMQHDFNFEIVNFPFLNGDVPRSPSYGVYIFLSLFVLLECTLMLMTSTTET